MVIESAIRLCLDLSYEAFKKGEVPIACVILKDGNPIASAHNRVEELKDPTAHAELLAIRQACERLGSKYLHGCEAYVSLEPCPMCAYAFVLARVERVVFLAQDERYGAVMSLYNFFEEPRFNHRVRWEYYPVEEAKGLLREFFRLRRANPSENLQR